MRVRNKARVMNPVRNTYGLAPNTVIKRSVPSTTTNTTTAQELNLALNGTIPGYNAPAPAHVNITQEIAAAAAALLAEYEAFAKFNGSYVLVSSNSTSKINSHASGSSSWMASIARKGTVPFGDDESYVVSTLI
jgi:hypothetical protein